MSSHFDKLIAQGLINPPHYLKNNIIYECICGSHAYATNVSTVEYTSDFDIFCAGIPLKELVFPHTAGEIIGFGRQQKKFVPYKKDHITCASGNVYDIDVIDIVKYFQLLMDNNPDKIDTLFVSQECVTHINSIGSMIRDNRKLFLHKGAYHRFIGYAHSQLGKMKSMNREGKRLALFEKFGFDVKFAMHLVRLSYECEQILLNHDIDLRLNSEHLKAIRRGDVSEADIRLWFASKEKYLLELYQTSTLRHSPDEPAIKQLLIDCLEHHYGSLEKCLVVDGEAKLRNAVSKIRCILDELE